MHLRAMLVVLCFGFTVSCWSQCLDAPNVEEFVHWTNTPDLWVDGGGSQSWTVKSWTTPSSGTGPIDDYDGTHAFIYCETSLPATSGDDFIIETPCFDSSTLTAPALEFAMSAFGSDIGHLSVEQAGATGGWTEVFSYSGDLGDRRWVRVSVPVVPVANTLRFRFVYQYGSGELGDLAIDTVSVAEVSQAPLRPEWELNDQDSSLDFDGILQTNSYFGPLAVTRVCATGTTTVTFDSVNIGLPWDVALTAGSSIESRTATGLETLNGQIVNLANVSISGSLFGLSLSNAFPGPIVAPLPSITLANHTAAQQVNVSPSHPDGFALSQASEAFVLIPTLPSFPVPPLQNVPPFSARSVVRFGCGLVPFYGTLYSQVFIEEHGQFAFGQTGSGGDRPSIAHVLSDTPSAGFLSRLELALNQSATISNPSGSLIQVDYTNLGYRSEPGTANNFSIAFDAVSGVITLSGLTGIMDHPISSGVPGGLYSFVGITNGEAGATDGGPTDFTLGSGAPASPTDMIYDFWSGAVSGPGRPPSLAAGIDVINFFPVGNSYTWTAY